MPHGHNFCLVWRLELCSSKHAHTIRSQAFFGSIPGMCKTAPGSDDTHRNFRETKTQALAEATSRAKGKVFSLVKTLSFAMLKIKFNRRSWIPSKSTKRVGYMPAASGSSFSITPGTSVFKLVKYLPSIAAKAGMAISPDRLLVQIVAMNRYELDILDALPPSDIPS